MCEKEVTAGRNLAKHCLNYTWSHKRYVPYNCDEYAEIPWGA